MRRLMLLAALTNTGVLTACFYDRNCDHVAASVEGSYRSEQEDATVVASADEVVVTYTRSDGARYRAVYRVREKRKD